MVTCSAAGCRGVKRTAKRTKESKSTKKAKIINPIVKKRKTSEIFEIPGILDYHPRTFRWTFVGVAYVYRETPTLFFCVKDHRRGTQTRIYIYGTYVTATTGGNKIIAHGGMSLFPTADRATALSFSTVEIGSSTHKQSLTIYLV